MRDLEDPLLSGHRLEGSAVVDGQHHVARGHENQLAQGPTHGGEDLAQRANGLADPLDRDAGIDQPLRSLQGDQVFEGVTTVAVPKRDASVSSDQLWQAGQSRSHSVRITGVEVAT